MPENEGSAPEREIIQTEIERIVREGSADIISVITAEALSNPAGGEVNINLEETTQPVGDLSDVDLEKLSQLLAESSEDMPAGVKITALGYDPEIGLTILIQYPAREEAEESPETEIREITFSGACAYCSEIVTEVQTVPVSAAGKIKTVKKTGKKYRDWDLGYISHTCQDTEESHPIFVFFREQLD